MKKVAVAWAIVLAMRTVAPTLGQETPTVGEHGDDGRALGAFNLPRTSDVERNANVLWTADLPEISLAAVVVGERVLMTAEPETLLCLDGVSGKLLWRNGVTLLGEYPSVVQAKARDALQKVVDYWKSGRVILGHFTRPEHFTWKPVAHQEEIAFLRKTCKIDALGLFLGSRGYVRGETHLYRIENGKRD